MNDEELYQLAVQLMGRQQPQQMVPPRLAQADQGAPMLDKDREKMQQAMQIQQAAQQFPQRMSQQLDLQTHTGMPPLPMLLKMQMRAKELQGINGGMVPNPNPVMMSEGGVRG